MVQAQTSTQVGFNRQSIEALSQLKGEPDWLRNLRLDAWHVYEETPLPAANDELWRRTSLKDLQLDKVVPFSEGPQANWSLQALPTEYQALLSRPDRGGIVVQHNSHNGYYQLADELKAKGVIFCDLDTAIREHPELVRQHYLERLRARAHAV